MNGFCVISKIGFSFRNCIEMFNLISGLLSRFGIDPRVAYRRIATCGRQGTSGVHPVVRGHRGCIPIVRGHRGCIPVVRGHRGCIPVVRGHRGCIPGFQYLVCLSMVTRTPLLAPRSSRTAALSVSGSAVSRSVTAVSQSSGSAGGGGPRGVGSLSPRLRVVSSEFGL